LEAEHLFENIAGDRIISWNVSLMTRDGTGSCVVPSLIGHFGARRGFQSTTINSHTFEIDMAHDRLSNFGPRERQTQHNAGRKLPPEPLSEQDIETIFRHFNSGWRPETYRARAFVAVCLRALLRPSEALDLYPKDINVKLGIVTVLNGKGGKYRVVGLDQKACLYVSEWMDERNRLGVSDDGPLFCVIQGRHRGRRLQNSWPRTLMTRLRKTCGIKKRLHPHGLRHTGAVQLLNERCPIEIISKQLGHSNIATTHRYIMHIHPTAVINWMQQRNW
jgi:site-specific recombinase XerD